MTKHTVDIQGLEKTVVVTIDGTEYDLPIEQAKEIHTSLGKAVGVSDKPTVVQNFFTTSHIDNLDASMVADSVARDLFWRIANAGEVRK